MTISGGINFSGLGNGTDFSQIVDKLKEVESMPMKRLESWKADWNKRYEAFGEIIASVREAKENLIKLNSPQKFLTKVAASSQEGTVGAKANADAVDGSHSVEVLQLASNSIWSFNGNFTSKTVKVNDTGTAQDFSYTYKGKTRTISVPNNTTLESFVNMVNQDRTNPGVKMNLIQTANGYTIQVQGKDSGASNDLVVHPSNILGLSGGSTTWSSNNAIDLDRTLSSYGAEVKDYTYQLTRHDGSTFSVAVKGNITKDDLATKINEASRATTPPGGDVAEIKNGKLELTDIQSMKTSVPGSSDSSITGKATTTQSATGTNESALLDPSLTEDDTIFYEITLSNGTKGQIELAGNSTRKDFIEAVNSIGNGVSAKVDTASGNYDMTFEGIQKIERVNSDGATPPVYTPSGDPLMDGISGTADTSWVTSTPAKGSDLIQSDVVPAKINYSLLMADGSTKTFTLDNSAGDLKMQDLVTRLESELGAGNVEVKDGKLLLKDVFSASGTGLGGQGQVAESSLWSIRKAQDARFKIDNWPQELTSATNEVVGVLDGVTLSLKDVGKAQVSVVSDRDSVKENIQTFLDTINTVVKKVQDLTKYDKDKQVYDTSTSKNNYYGSQFNTQKGGVLTGNYGVQLFNTRLKTTMSGTPPGFNSRTGEDIFSGDFVAALAQMGIKTCSQEGNPNYGMFMIAPPGTTDTMQAMDQERFDKAITDNLDDVIAFFASDDVGTSSSFGFRYTNHIKGMTKPGTYGVSYEVLADGTISNVLINGVKAGESDLAPGTFTVSNAGAASGLSITIDDLTPGKYNGNVSIKQGKVRQMEDFFASEMVFHEPTATDPTAGKENGGLMILQSNYMQIMKNIDKKISLEEDRINRWERTQRMAFSRLETLLGQYDRNMQSLSSQMGQLQQ